MLEYSEVRGVCEKIRNLFDEHGKDFGFLFSDFPIGCCGIISMIIGIYLEEHGFGVYNYVCGEMEDGSTHAWLESGGVIIDIILDQFGIQYSPVYVGNEQGGELSKKISCSNSKIIIIDELDKADESIFTFFYEMLEDGQFTDLDANVYDLDGYIVIFTANLNNNNFKEKIPEPLFSRIDMTYEFLPLTIEDKTRFINEFIDGLLLDYQHYISTEINIEEIKGKVICRINLAAISNLRNIKRNIMNEFIDIVGTKKLWDEELIE